MATAGSLEHASLNATVANTPGELVERNIVSMTRTASSARTPPEVWKTQRKKKKLVSCPWVRTGRTNMATAGSLEHASLNATVANTPGELVERNIVSMTRTASSARTPPEVCDLSRPAD